MFERRNKTRRAAVLGALWRGSKFLDDICAYTGLRLGPVSVVLSQLEDERIVTSEWVDGPYPRRRVYYVWKDLEWMDNGGER